MPKEPDHRRALDRVARLADLLDRAYRIPGTNIRFGLDPLIGIIPVVGDTIAFLLGLYPLAEAARLGVRRRAILRMLVNLAIDWLVGLIPLLDLIFDTAYKANLRNVRILRDELLRREAP